MVAFPCKNGAPVKGITLSTRVGRLSRTHFELGLSVNAISQGKEWLNGKVESQRNCRCFNKKVFIRDCGKRTAAKRLQVCGGKTCLGVEA